MKLRRETIRKGSAQAGACKGFTLIELLVSMTVLSLLATIILFGWRIATSAWQKASTRLEQSRAVTEANHLVEEQISSMLPYQAQTDRGNLTFFQGEPDAARFISHYSLAGRAATALYEIEYQLEETSAGRCSLLMNEEPVNSMGQLGLQVRDDEITPNGSMRRRYAPFAKTASSITLIEGMKDCHFEYYQPATPGSKGGWTQQWAAVEFLPTAMALRFTEDSASSLLKPVSLVATIRFNAKPNL